MSRLQVDSIEPELKEKIDDMISNIVDRFETSSTIEKSKVDELEKALSELQGIALNFAIAQNLKLGPLRVKTP